ncbi:EAL domain-containing protein [Hydrogenimonas sp.]
MKRLLHLDKLTWALLALMALMLFLLGYLLSIDRDIAGYTFYQEKIRAMRLLDKEFDNFLLQKIEAQNYEDINRKLVRFEKLLDYFEKQNLASEYGPRSLTLLHRIKKRYAAKRHAIERFKSDNAAALNSIHYLFDLRRTITEDRSLPQPILKRIDAIMFKLMQLIVGLHPSTASLEASLEAYRRAIAPSNHLYLHYFLKHSLNLMESFKQLTATSLKGRRIPLESAIQAFGKRIATVYEEKIATEKRIALLFFVLSFAMLVAIFFLNRRERRTYKRLQAFMYAVENSDNTIVMTDPQRNIVYVNELFEKTTGYSKEEAIGQNPRILKSGEQDESFYAEMNATLDAGKKWEGVFINKRKDGSLYYEKASIVPVYIDGELANYLAIKLDITEYVEQRNRLRLAATVFDNAQEMIMITDRNNRFVSVNPAFTTVTGYSEEEVKGQTPGILKSGRHDDAFYEKMWERIEKTGKWHGKIYNRIKSGEVIPGWLTISAVYDDKGEVLNYIGMITDLREIIDSQERAEYLAYHDIITGLPNRARFEEHLFHALEVAERNENALAVLFIDLDRFKVINDTLGHDIGDLLLKEVSNRIRAVLRKSDMLARIGGDEFVAVLETIRSAEDAAYVCEKILKNIAQPYRVGNNTLNVSASIGVALYPDNGTSLTELIKNADNAMYLAKSLGKNNFQFFMPELSRKMHRRLEIEQGLIHALENREFYLVLQPQYHLLYRSVEGAEALLRWKSESLGIVPPDEFIAVAEETGRINEIGRFVFEEACAILKRFDHEGLGLDTIAVNVSSKQFTQRDLPDIFHRIALTHGIEPGRITLEMTERYIMDTSSYDGTILARFRELGFRISVDDFGTGYSSMSYLKELPIDTIKIDKSFIQDIPEDSSDKEITKAIIALSHSLGYKTVAEGIENEAQERFLVESGCLIGQGYFFARPLPVEEFAGFLRRHAKASK